MNSNEILRRLGRGERIADVCVAANMSREQFDSWWREEMQRRAQVPDFLIRTAELWRDARGVPHLRAAHDRDLFAACGFATAQDRLFQLDFLRRKALGRLAEILGPEAIESDLLNRTIGLHRIAESEWQSLPEETRNLLQAFCDGINTLIEVSGDDLPIEFDLLDYRPEPWRPQDSLAILGEFRWYLTGRFPVILIPELVKRAVGDGPLYREFLLGEADEASILHPGEYPVAAHGASKGSSGGGDGWGGSNNWVLDGSRTTSGKPIVASDPHVPYHAVSIWHEIVLEGGSFNVAGVSLAGVPGAMIGRNKRVAWGITNNICSLRDLYHEKTDPAHPGCFLHDGCWEPETTREEVIAVRGGEAVRKIIRLSRNGPIVDEALPAPARSLGPISLRWVGFEDCGWLTATLNMNRARSGDEFREAGRSWKVPTFNLVFADVDGHIGHQTVGSIPIRKIPERGLRPGWDPEHQWAGFIPYDELPHLNDPKRGYVVTANNRVAPDDFKHPMSGTWSGGYRAKRIREELESRAKWSREDCQKLQMDVYSHRAAACVPPLLTALDASAAARLLREWDFRIAPESAPAAIFNVFFAHWSRIVMRERLPVAEADLVAGLAGGLAARLLADDPLGWFRRDRRAAIREAFAAALEELATRLGPDINRWSWGAIHPLSQKHFLSSRGDLGWLLDRSGLSAPGDGTTVCSGTQDATHAAWLGAGYRMVVDLAEPTMWSIEVAGSSGHPGSPHYDDMIDPWSRGELFPITLNGS